MDHAPASATLCLGQLLSAPFHFAIPVYQRPYSWTLTEADQLLDDVLEAAGIEPNVDERFASAPEESRAQAVTWANGESGCFLGTILLMDPSRDPLDLTAPAPATRVLDIVDGQQRLVTVSILIAVLRDLLAEDGAPQSDRLHDLIAAAADADRSHGCRIELRGALQALLARAVLPRGATLRRLAEDATDILADVEAAGGDATARISGPVDTAAERIVSIRDRFVATLERLDTPALEHLADFLATACHVVVLVTRDVDRAHRLFVVLNGRGKPLARNDILKAEILQALPPDRIAWADDAWMAAAGRLGAEAFEAFFSHVRTIHGETRPQVIAAIRAIVARSGGPVAFITDQLLPLAAAYETVRSAHHEGLPQSAAIRRTLLQLRRLPGEDWVPAAMAAIVSAGADSTLLARQLDEIDRFAHILRLLCLGTGKRVTRFAPVVAAVVRGDDLSLPGGPTRIDREDQRAIAYNLRDLHGRNPQMCKIVLLRLNDIMSGELVDLDPAAYSVEHVLPQRPAANSTWRQWFPETAERERCTASLGNMALLGQRQNDRARNQELVRKHQIYADPRDEPLPAVSRDVLGHAQWRPEHVRAREKRFLLLLERMWRMGINEAVATPDSAAAAALGKRRRRHPV